MKHLIPAFLCLFIVLQAHAQDKNPLIDSAFKYIDAGNYGKAINLYTRMLAADTTNARVYELRGFAYEEMKDYESAMRDYNSSVRANPRYWQAYFRRADLFRRGEYFDHAITDYAYALRFSDSASQKEMILVNRAEAKRRMKNIEGAVEDYKRALEFNPQSIAALSNLGAMLPEIGKPQEAIASLEKVIRIDSTFEGGYGNLAFLYAELGEYKKALDISNKLLSFKPEEPYALNNRGFIKYKMGNLEDALEDINNSIKRLPENSYAFKNRGLVYIAMKKKKEACTDFQKAIKLGFTEYYGDEVEKLIKTHCSEPALRNNSQ